MLLIHLLVPGCNYYYCWSWPTFRFRLARKMAAIASPLAPPCLQFQPRDVFTTINYYNDAGDGSKPQAYIVGQARSYYRPPQPHPVTVHDIRGKEENFTLDTHGFQLFRHESKENEFLDLERIKKEYYAETEQLLKDV